MRCDVLPTRCILVSVLVLVAACAGPSYRQQVLDDIQLRAQERILHHARLDFEEGNYQAVIRRLTRLLTTHPSTSLHAEALWLLARSFEERSEWHEALLRYQALVAHSSTTRYRARAKNRIAEIQRYLDPLRKQRRPVRAVHLVFPLDPKKSEALDREVFPIEQIVQEGDNTLLIDLGCEVATRDRAVPTKVEIRSFDPSIFESQLSSWIAIAREKGLSVYLGVHLRCLGHLHFSPPERWRDRRYNPMLRTLEVSPFYDLFHPDYRTFLFQTLESLSLLDLDGIVYVSDPPLGPYDGFSMWASRAFNRAFGFHLSLPTLFNNGQSPQPSHHRAVAAEATSVTTVAPEFWRWAGWKMRQRLHLLQMLTQRLRRARPSLEFGVNLHLLGFQAPNEALICLSEDVLEAARSSFDIVMIMTGRSTYESCRPWNADSGSASLSSLNEKQIGRLLDLVEPPRQLWIHLPHGFSDRSSELVEFIHRSALPGNGAPSNSLGLVYER